MPIIDPHHHLWDFPSHRYLLQDFLADTGSGHNIEQTVFLECAVFYRPDVGKDMRYVGEVEFANGIAAMAASGRYGPTKVAAGIVGRAELTMGGAVEEVLSAQIAAGLKASAMRQDGKTKPGEFTIVTPTHRNTSTVTTISFARVSPNLANLDSRLTRGYITPSSMILSI